MFLINALYFLGDWEKGFPEEGTYDRNFTLSDGSKVPVPMMHVDEYLNFFIGNDLQAVDLGFGDSSVSMGGIQPMEESAPIDAFIRGLDKSRLIDLWNRDLYRSRLFLGLPKFEIAQDLNLNDALKALGMGIAFDPSRADLGRLGQAFGNLYISRVKHKTYLAIDETGAEGAAVTAVGVGVTSAPPTLFFDRPFFFVIRDLQFNSILFAGKVENPVQG
jgi:serpin B